MGYFESLILGIVQGLTEFLPVSSSGHLELFKALLGGDALPEESMMFTVVVHFATALSTVVVFRKDIGKIFSGLFEFRNNEEARFSLKIIISMLPAALVGVLLEKQLEALFDGQISLVGLLLIVTGLLLFLADKASKTEKSVSYKNAIVIGIAQAIAILPGISRSGATISTSVLLGIDRERAARFSFLMVVPLIFGKIILDLRKIGEVSSTGDAQFTTLLIGFLAAFFTGLFACNLMISLVKKAQLKYFSFYCFVVGGIAAFAGFYYY